VTESCSYAAVQYRDGELCAVFSPINGNMKKTIEKVELE